MTDYKLTLGPLLYNWPADKARDFYFHVADEVDVDRVYIGEVVCSKRQPLHAKYFPEVVQRLQDAGKEVVLSTLALIMNEREIAFLKDTAAASSLMIEANDIAAVSLLAGKPFVCGPFINTYNEDTLMAMESLGATSVVLPFELPRSSLAALAKHARVPLEVQVFGRLPLAMSARCYHARAYNLHKDNCQFVCERDADGMDVHTIDQQPFLAVNGTQVQSFTCCNLINEIDDLRSLGISQFRISPQAMDMKTIVSAFRNMLEHSVTAGETMATLHAASEGMEFANGYYHAVPGKNYRNISE